MESRRYIDAATLKAVVRLETNLGGLIDTDILANDYILKDLLECDCYRLTLDDLETAIKNMRDTGMTYAQFKNVYFRFLMCYSQEITFVEYGELSEEGFLVGNFPRSENQMLFYLNHFFTSIVFDFGRSMEVEHFSDDTETFIDYDLVLGDIDTYKKGGKIKPWNWNYRLKKLTLRIAEQFDLNEFGEEGMKNLKELLEELLADKDTDAIHFKAYCNYGGNQFYECDWNAAKDSFIYLMKSPDVSEDHKLQYANTLGYIYYYGRCNDGVPEYEKAFYFYSIGAAGGYTESNYKIADMFLNGYGIEKNVEAAKRIILKLFHETQDAFLSGDWTCNFADVALRMGNLYKEKLIKDERDPEYAALRLYGIAELALKYRMKVCNNYGDDSLLEKIESELKRLRFAKNVPTRLGTDEIEIKLPGPKFLYEAFKNDSTCLVTIEKGKNSTFVSAKRIPVQKNSSIKYFFEEEPFEGICQLATETQVACCQVINVELTNKKGTFLANEMNFRINGEVSTMEFFFLGNKVASVTCGSYYYNYKPELPMPRD